MTRPTWRTVAIGLALALTLALAGLVVVLVRDDAGPTRGSDATAETLLAAEADAEKAARAAAISLTTYDYQTLDTDFDWVVTAGTPAFRDRYADVVTATRKVVTELKVHAVGSVDAAAATAQDADHVTVLLFVDQTLTSDAGAERRLATPRVRMSMVRSGSRWLVDDAAVRNLLEQ